jgi:hypothetical protein
MNPQYKPTDVFYFGSLGRGHYLHLRGTQCHHNVLEGIIPWSYGIDGKVLEKAKIPDDPNGQILHVQRDGWTAIAFWDRSGDARRGSNSAFIANALLKPEELLVLAREQWPEVFERKGFPELRLVTI